MSYRAAALGILGVLLEPTTVVAKAWEQILAIGQRTFWEPETVLVIGAGPIGVMTALALRARGVERVLVVEKDERRQEQIRRNQAVIALLTTWEQEDPAEQREAVEFLMQALNEDRTSDRKLFA